MTHLRERGTHARKAAPMSLAGAPPADVVGDDDDGVIVLERVGQLLDLGGGDEYNADT